MYEHNALGYRSGLALCLTKVRSSRARCPATALIMYVCTYAFTFYFMHCIYVCIICRYVYMCIHIYKYYVCLSLSCVCLLY